MKNLWLEKYKPNEKTPNKVGTSIQPSKEKVALICLFTTEYGATNKIKDPFRELNSLCDFVFKLNL